MIQTTNCRQTLQLPVIQYKHQKQDMKFQHQNPTFPSIVFQLSRKRLHVRTVGCLQLHLSLHWTQPNHTGLMQYEIRPHQLNCLTMDMLYHMPQLFSECHLLPQNTGFYSVKVCVIWLTIMASIPVN